MYSYTLFFSQNVKSPCLIFIILLIYPNKINRYLWGTNLVKKYVSKNEFFLQTRSICCVLSKPKYDRESLIEAFTFTSRNSTLHIWFKMLNDFYYQNKELWFWNKGWKRRKDNEHFISISQKRKLPEKISRRCY